MKKLFLIALSLIILETNAQTDSTTIPLKLSGYLETYYCYDFGDPSNHERPNFIYSHNRHNEVTLNLGYIKAAYEDKNVRANIAFMTGTYSNANLALEPGVLKNIFEANMGFKLSKKKSLWVDAGIFSSHIGFESAVGKNCWTLTRSIMAENSPYYESGAKISYTSNTKKWFLSGLILNGWQHIQRTNGNNTPAFGHQLSYSPNSKITINSSSFVGSDSPDSVRKMRYFHDLYGQFQVHKNFGLILGFDIGAQQKNKGSNNYSTWYTPILIAKLSLSEKVNIAARGEYYSDKEQAIITTGTKNGFQTIGYSLNFDFFIYKTILWRIEGKGFNSSDAIFTSNKKLSNQNYCLTSCLAISL